METTQTPGSGPLGFIGIGVMGQAMASNLVLRSGRPVVVHDLDQGRLAQMSDLGAEIATTVAEVARRCDLVFLSLPHADAVASVVLGPGGLAQNGRAGQTIVDLSTSRVSLEQQIAERLRGQGIAYLDAPVSRTHAAAVTGTLAVTVGADEKAEFDRVEPVLRLMATDITYCGKPGAGTLVKLLNNLVVFETVTALAEAITVVRRSGLIGDELFFEALGRGSAASFALANHGLKSLLPDTHPTGLFSVEYMLKDVGYALEYARDVGAQTQLGELAQAMLRRAQELGYGDRYHTAVVRAVEETSGTGLG